MDKMPEVIELSDGSNVWSQSFEKFRVKIYVPQCELMTDMINYGFRTPYLMIFEEKELTIEEAKTFADEKGLSKIAKRYGGSVAFFYPTNEGGWKNAPEDLFTSIISESKISQYYKDGAAIMRDRFTGKWNGYYIRGAVLRTYLYGNGESADYITTNCLKHIKGDGLYGKGDVTPVVCILDNLSVMPKSTARDIPVVSIGNSEAVNESLKASQDYIMIKDKIDYVNDFDQFIGTFRRMVGNLEKEANLEEMGMMIEPDCCEVHTSPDDRGDDKDTKTHKIGFVAYYNKHIMDKGHKVPLVMCFHGGGDSAMCMASLSGWSMVAHDHDFLLVCVENHMNSTATETVEVIEYLKKKYTIDEEKIYSSGFSMGGCKSWDFYQEYPQIFAAVAPMDATFEVGENVFAGKVDPINQETIVPVFYVGGEITPLPELPFQAEKCLNRMAYVMRINQCKTPYQVTFSNQENWTNKIWGIDGDIIRKSHDDVRNSDLTMNLFESKNGCCYAVFSSVSGQGHEVRYHSCEHAYRYMSQFKRLITGEIVGGRMEEIAKLLEK